MGLSHLKHTSLSMMLRESWEAMRTAAKPNTLYQICADENTYKRL